MKSQALILLLLSGGLFISSGSSGAWGEEVKKFPSALTLTVTQEVTALVEKQVAAWNRGDIPRFMQGYAQTDEVRFASGGTVTYGWRATLERYQRGYPDRGTMGTLALSELAVTELGTDAAMAFGRWRLTRGAEAQSGLFTLILRKTAAGWRIQHDHTSNATP